VTDLVPLLAPALNARTADEGRSPFSKPGGGTRIGDKVMDERITLYSDPGDPMLLGQPFDNEGLPLRRVVVYRNGVGYFERGAEVDGEQVSFKMRQRMVGDFLATLAIVERGGSSLKAASFPLEMDKDDPVAQDPRFDRMLQAWNHPGEPPRPPPKPDDRLRKVILSLDGKEHDLAVGYVAATPLWRPSYRVVVDKQGADLQVWGIVQNLSGEDWKDVELQFSTARSSLGTEPPLLHPDLLTVKKKNEAVVVQARQVQVQKAGLGSAPAAGGARPTPTSVDLPGVDDGGETRNLRALGKCSIPSDGRPNVIPLFTFEDGAEAALVTFPELEPKVFLRAVARNTSPSPMLAGPVFTNTP
jgi:hypothetical protein